ncbi:hypothetical protein CLV24_106169 [Pontibacter ummariensis]|uniref:Uncharacterized protein n=1 Tax=Pontibacter ummariensis TaxID=1610492 RepID=A0A239EIZ6_9BACT|nr:hypothetical protein [Pontibacter ummariensis]PRY13254.1 hypothetical protein CLV24_106169 [Pontibacter ummariensis]SNS43872.1 hypothetical protein SAMN06296052_106169 [Pontibacter ummariensis]
MNTMTNPVPLIAKEQLHSFRFAQEDVLTDLAARQKRQWDINRATSLGNAYRGKVEITFQTAEGEKKRVDTTVWAVDDLFMILKAGRYIPIISVLGVEFF